MKNKALKLTLLLLVFIAPLIGALFVYQARDGIHFMTNNAGTLIRPSISFDTLGKLPSERRWWMVYYSDEGCDIACEKTIHYFETIRETLFQDQHRLGIILITKWPMDDSSSPDKYVMNLSHDLPAGLPVENGRAIWLVDPLGNIILNYDPTQLDNRLLLDLRHLLKVSRIG